MSAATAVVTRAALATLAALLVACGGNRTEAGGAGVVPGDTVRGIVVVTGAEPATRVVLRRDDGRVPVAGELADSLRALDGLDVWLAGERLDDGGFRPQRFRVRGMGRLPATDGRLELDGEAAVLVTAGGERIRFPAAPASLRELAGRRVWIAGRPGEEPQAWGAIGR